MFLPIYLQQLINQLIFNIMKKLLLPVFALLALASCNNEEIQDIQSNELVAIKLNAGLVQTRAAIESDAAGKLTAELIGVQFIRVDGATTDWITATAASFTGNIGTDGKITEFEQYYPTDGSNANIVGYYPAATSIAAGKLSMTIDGSNDVIYAAPVSGSKTVAMPAMAFNHKLTQFKFIVKIDGTTVTEEVTNVNVSINNANTTFDMAIADGAITNFATPINTIKAMTNATTSATASEGIMLEPNLSSLSVKITADGYTEKDIAITPNASETKFEEGKVYTITLVLSKVKIEASATVGQWIDGTNPNDFPVE